MEGILLGFGDLLPAGSALHDVLHQASNLTQRHTDLQHGVSFSQSHGVILLGLSVDGDGIGDTNLIGSGIALTDRLTSRVHLVGQVVGSQRRS